MRLKIDDRNGVYVWVDDANEDEELSPHFDYEEDAIQWYGIISRDIFSEYGISKNENT